MSKKLALLSKFELFRGSGGGIEAWFSDGIPDAVVDTLSDCEKQNVSFEILNQLLILSHEAGMTYSFFEFYFLTDPHAEGLYWYDPKKLPEFDQRFLQASLGKPVIFFCDTDTKLKIFRDIHPLARLINFHNGVAVGSIVMDDRREVPEMVRRIFNNDMEFTLAKKNNNYFLLQEKLTGSTIRVQSNNSLLRETFWNYYHREPPFRRG